MKLSIELDDARELMFEQLCEEHGLDEELLRSTLEQDAETVVKEKIQRLYDNPDSVEER